MAARFSGVGQPYEGLVTLKRRVRVGERDQRTHVRTIDGRKINDGLVSDPRWSGEVRFVAERLSDPLRWRKPRRIFVNSMSDLFHEKLTNEQIAAVFGVMAAAKQHTFQILTKRPKRMREWFAWAGDHGAQGARSACRVSASSYLGEPVESAFPPAGGFAWPLPNVWIGVSVEDQRAADDRIPDLLATPAAVRFLSCEPLIGEVDLTRIGMYRGEPLSALDEIVGHVERPAISWVIAGCESGPGARACEVAWLRGLRDQCRDARVPFFLKQAEGALEIHHGAHRRASLPITGGPGSKKKGRGARAGIFELPYLDGVQHASFPEVSV
jgi:protein gp37